MYTLKIGLVKIGLAAFLLMTAVGSMSYGETIAVVPDTVSVVGVGPFALGWSFTVNEEISVTSLGAFDILGDGPATGQLARIYDATNDTVLVTAAIDNTATVETCNGYDVYYQSITPLALTPGVEYIVAISQGLAGDIMNSTSLLTKGSEIDPISGRATAYPSPANLNGNLPDSVSDFSIATNNPVDLYLGAQFKYTSVPEPGTTVLLVMGVLGTMLCVRRRKQ